MTEDRLMHEVRELRERGLSPKEIARSLGVRPAAVADLVRVIGAERGVAAAETELAGSWVSPGWSVGLSIDGRRDWPDPGGETSSSGLVTTVVARRKPHRRETVVCVYLVDVYCLGVKNAIGPRQMDAHDLRGFMRKIFGGYESPAVPAPIELVRNLVYGAIDYAGALGFDPHPDFEQAREHLGPWSGPGAIRFGCDGKPMFVQGPYDDAASILRTLRGSTGRRGSDVTTSPGAGDRELVG